MEIRAEHCVLPTPSPVMEATFNVFWSCFYITGAFVVFALSRFFSVVWSYPSCKEGWREGREEGDNEMR